jgi:hypothetical protein
MNELEMYGSQAIALDTSTLMSVFDEFTAVNIEKREEKILERFLAE